MLPCMLVVGTFDESLKIGVLQALQSKHFNIVSITTMHGDHFKGGADRECNEGKGGWWYPNNFGKYEKIQSSFQTQENSTTI